MPSSSSPKRSEPAAHPCRGPGGQGGNEHGGSPWFQAGVEPGRAPAGEGRESLTPRGDERDRSLSHCGAVSFKTNFSPEIRCQFIILARKDELTPRGSDTEGLLARKKDELTPRGCEKMN